jgi:hypothetical protein
MVPTIFFQAVKACIENEDSQPLCCVPTVVDVARVSARVAPRVSSRVSPGVAPRVAPRVAPPRVTLRVALRVALRRRVSPPRVSPSRVSPALPILRRMLALLQKLP